MAFVTHRALRRRSFAEDASLDIRDAPFVPPRFELRRVVERVLANIGAVCIWTVRVAASVPQPRYTDAFLTCTSADTRSLAARVRKGLWDQARRQAWHAAADGRGS